MGELPMPPGLYNMDCMAAMKQFPDGFFDLAVVDPPYGINVTGRHKASALVGGVAEHSAENPMVSLSGTARSRRGRLNFTTPSTTPLHRTRGISES